MPVLKVVGFVGYVKLPVGVSGGKVGVYLRSPGAVRLPATPPSPTYRLPLESNITEVVPTPVESV